MKFTLSALFLLSGASTASAKGQLRQLDSSDETCASAIPAGTSFEITTSWDLDADTAVSYPCSTGYAKNFAANPNLLEDVLAAIDGKLDGCSALCNINNGSYGSSGGTGSGDLSDILESRICDALSAEAQSTDSIGFSANACVCGDDGTISGCSSCSATVTFSVVSCLDIAP